MRPENPKFCKNNRIFNINTKKAGIIQYMRDSDWHRNSCEYYYYVVKYDDGTSETLENENNLILNIKEN